MSDDKPMKLTSEGNTKALDWKHAQERLARAKSEVNRAECDLANAVTAFGKWLTPTDAKPGETFNVWFIDTLIACSKKEPGKNYGGGDYDISLRTTGREWTRLT